MLKQLEVHVCHSQMAISHDLVLLLCLGTLLTDTENLGASSPDSPHGRQGAGSGSSLTKTSALQMKPLLFLTQWFSFSPSPYPPLGQANVISRSSRLATKARNGDLYHNICTFCGAPLVFCCSKNKAHVNISIYYPSMQWINERSCYIYAMV